MHTDSTTITPQKDVSFKTPVVPKRLKPGDTLAIISPAGPTKDETQWKKGIQLLETVGFHVKLGQYAKQNTGYLAGTDQERVYDLHWAFTHPEINGILCARGGYGCMKLLPLIDWTKIDQNPKILIGFSDVTALLLPIWQKAGIVGFYGPMLTSNLCHDEPDSLSQLLDVVRDQQQYPFEIKNYNDYVCLKPGFAKGRLLGGNLSLLTSLCGTPYQPDTSGCILFVEDWHESPYTLDRKFQQMKLAGLLDNIAALLLCDFSEMNDDPDYFNESRQWPDFWRWLTQDLNIPVGLGFSVGHGKQTGTLPIGVNAQFDAQSGQLLLLEAPVI
jgi:muramoyltetrapeptide carboxypeptidase